VPAEVDDIIRTMLALEPAKRYPGARAAADALDQVLRRHSSTTQVAASTPPLPLRLRQRRQKRRTPLKRCWRLT
jgi:hypothetical protein